MIFPAAKPAGFMTHPVPGRVKIGFVHPPDIKYQTPIKSWKDIGSSSPKGNGAIAGLISATGYGIQTSIVSWKDDVTVSQNGKGMISGW